MRKTKIKKNDGFVGEKMIIIPKSITEKYFFNPFVERLYLTDVGYFPNAEGHFVERKEGVPEWIFFYCISGEGIIRLGEKSFSLSAKTALCIPPNVSHTYFADKDNPWSILWVHFNGKDVNLFPLQQVELIKFQATHSSNTMLFYFDQLFNAAEDYNEKNIIHISHIIQIILSETYYKSCILSYDKKSNTTLECVKKFFTANLDKMLSLDEICSEFYLSKSYLNAIFKKNTGLSPINYFNAMKMKEACKLLRSTQLPIKHIASKLGYDDPYYFSFLFKKIVSVSPSEYRSSNLIFF